jgi:NADH-quinone oxidoreductase subunit L
MDFVIHHSYLIPLLPLLGAAVAGFFGARYLKGNSHWPIWIGVGGSAVLSFTLLFGMLARWHPHDNAGHAGTSEHAARAGTPAAVSPTETAAEAEAPARLAAAQDNEADESSASLPETRREFPTLAFGRHLYTWIRAGSKQVEATDDHGKPVFDASGEPVTKTAPDFEVSAGFLFDPLSAVMLCVITGIGFLITVFSKGYMAGEEGYFRFFAYLGLFIFMMTILVMGENLVMLYLGWEGVGLCSYLLIGYYYDKPAAREAAKKAFLVNRVGDFGFGLGIMLCFFAFGTVSYFGNLANPGDGLLEQAVLAARDLNPLTTLKQDAMQWIPFLLMLGAFGKSAQFPLYVWLPDAMEGPTPVSALIHAATMVTAGVYMIVRCGTLFVTNQPAMNTIAVVGAFTALFAATIALRQFDLKKVFAYSTVSQLGFMFVGVAVWAPVAGVFHLVTHAFFKALLFLGSGVVMHAMAGVLDMRKMSGLRRVLPWTDKFVLVGCLALAGFPFLSGFFSKDEIVGAAMERSIFLGGVMLLTAFLTAYYTFRLYFRVFRGPLVLPEAPAGAHGHGHDHPAHGAHAGDPATASESAIRTGDTARSGVDEHLARDPAHHGHAPRGDAGQKSHDPGHGHGHGAGSHDAPHNHEPLSMMLPLAILTIGALLVGYLNWPERARSLGGFLGQSPSFVEAYRAAEVLGGRSAEHFGVHDPRPSPEGHELFPAIMIVSGFTSVVGIFLAYVMHLRDRGRAERLAAGMAPVTRLLEARYYVDEVYQNVIVEPLRALGRAFFWIDRWVIDFTIGALSWVPQFSGYALKLTVQRGYLQGYAAAMLFGVAVILLIIFL